MTIPNQENVAKIMGNLSDFDSDSDDSYLEKQMDMYIAAKCEKKAQQRSDIGVLVPNAELNRESESLKPKSSSLVAKDEVDSFLSSSDDSYIEKYIDQLKSTTIPKTEPSIRLQGTTVRQDLEDIPVSMDGYPDYFADYSLSDSDFGGEENNNRSLNKNLNEDRSNTEYEYIRTTPDLANGLEKPVDFNNLTIDTLIYPTNYPIREYQKKIVETCIKNNTLVAIPTGTGKTFIAAVIMLNFFRWFCLKDNQLDIIKTKEDEELLSTRTLDMVPSITAVSSVVKKKLSIKELLSKNGTFEVECSGPVAKGKIVFVAPTRPLVAQIIQACLGITGIPPEHVCILLDKKPKERIPLYEKNSVFIGTPQIIEKDLYNGVLSPHDIKLLIIDECHKSTGNFSYVKIVDYVNRFCKNNFRIVGLSATPTNSVEGLENIVENLQVSKIELRTENSPDLKKYMKSKDVIENVLYPTENPFIAQIVECVSICIEPLLHEAIKLGIYPSISKPAFINAFLAMESKRKVVDNPNLSEGLKWHQFFILTVLYDFGFLMQKLNSFGIRTFYHCLLFKKLEFDAKFKIGKTKNKQMIQFYNHDNITECLESCKEYLYKSDESHYSIENFQVSTHPKFDKLLEELYDFFEENSNADSRVIVFSSFRDVALEIVKTIDAQNDVSGSHKILNPHLFIGQSSGKKAFDPETFILENSTKRTSGLSKKQREMKLKQLESIKKAEKEILKERRHDSRIQTSEDAQSNGMTQPQQKKVIEDFKKGLHNILVCTSIGEEGLDIGEVDLIIFFDATASLVRNIQRMGRTGRKRDGRVSLLLTKREMTKFKQSFEEYEKLQTEIQLYGDQFLKYSCDMYPKDKQYKIKYAEIIIEEESEKLTELDDTDKVIDLGTQMTQAVRLVGNNSGGKGKFGLQKKKQPKVFNYPNNVNAKNPPGFRNVGSMLQKVAKNKTTKISSGGVGLKRKQVAFKPSDGSNSLLTSKFQKVNPGSSHKVSFDEQSNNIIEFSD